MKKCTGDLIKFYIYYENFILNLDISHRILYNVTQLVISSI